MLATARQTGFALIEVLIAIVILTVGAIGAAGMQMSALRTAQQSKYHTAAVELAMEMADKMRSNSTQMKGSGSPFVGFDYLATPGTEPARPSAVCYGVASCGSADLASFDLFEWSQRMQRELPDGRALICRDSAPWSSGAGGLKWACSPPAGGAGVVIKIGWPARNPGGKFASGDSGAFLPAIAIPVEPYVK